ncbi:ferric reductase like transmembrane component-domain-containing protein [Ampelomyces quisqualis]|uniref:ferric-chelate reductase (NADPH) n=1 Tax=Ampelomyces quisqualis TaxID=50730 RepID=A0A6A5QUU0_AMPQU|nr:ferric reductase like transmembrane component-domain-containing protein [Ampelomyces quisqualis]
MTIPQAMDGLFKRAGGGHAPEDPKNGLENIDVQHYLGLIWWTIVAAFALYQVVLFFVRYIRTVSSLGNETQRYFVVPNYWYARFKKSCLDAPLFRTRHHREFKMSSAIGVGTLPSRLQTFFLVGYFAVNIVFCIWRIDYSSLSKAAPELLSRTGIMAVINMIPLFLLAGRNNPIITLTGISFDTMNLIHRWFGRIVVLEAIAHAVCYIANKVHTKGSAAGWAAVQAGINNSTFIMSGFIGTVAFFFLLIQSPSPIRHSFYEVFLHGHIVGAALALGAVWVHLDGRDQQFMLYGVLALWVMERTLRFVRLVGRNVGNGGTSADVEVLPGDALRVTVRMARPWTFRPGQHAYLYMPSVGLWTNHPFSIAWSEEEETNSIASSISDEKGLPMNRQDILEHNKTSMSFIIRRRTGFTDKLFRKADLSAAGRFSTSAFVEGPYGGEDLSSYGTVMLWAAGIGITHQVPHVRDIVAGYANGTVATRRLTLVWIIQSPEHLEWIRTWMTQILAMPRRREILKILLFVTRPRRQGEIVSPSSSVQMFPGRPNVQSLVDQEMQEGIGAACVSTCGTGGLADELRRAVRNRELQWNVDFREESFSW